MGCTRMRNKHRLSFEVKFRIRGSGEVEDEVVET